MILQKLSCVPPNYMDNQQDLNERMRGILIDWLIEVDRSRQKLFNATFFCLNVPEDKLTGKLSCPGALQV